jgi:hypothetical protein
MVGRIPRIHSLSTTDKPAYPHFHTHTQTQIKKSYIKAEAAAPDIRGKRSSSKMPAPIPLAGVLTQLINKQMESNLQYFYSVPPPARNRFTRPWIIVAQ